jgi:hypothetical protein
MHFISISFDVNVDVNGAITIAARKPLRVGSDRGGWSFNQGDTSVRFNGA